MSLIFHSHFPPSTDLIKKFFFFWVVENNNPSRWRYVDPIQRKFNTI